jgi:hypothetical protein
MFTILSSLLQALVILDGHVFCIFLSIENVETATKYNMKLLGAFLCHKLANLLLLLGGENLVVSGWLAEAMQVPGHEGQAHVLELIGRVITTYPNVKSAKNIIVTPLL